MKFKSDQIVLRGSEKHILDDVNEVNKKRVRSKQHNKSVNIITGVQRFRADIRLSTLSLLFLNAKERNTSLRFRAFSCLDKQTTYKGVHFLNHGYFSSFSLAVYEV